MKIISRAADEHTSDIPEGHLEPVTFDVVGANVILEYEERPDETTTTGGVILPGTNATVRSSEAHVVGAGPEAMVFVGTHECFRIEVGDRLIVHRHKLVKLELDADDGRELFVGHPGVIIGVQPRA